MNPESPGMQIHAPQPKTGPEAAEKRAWGKHTAQNSGSSPGMDIKQAEGCGVYSSLLTTGCLWRTALHGKEGCSMLPAGFTDGGGGAWGAWHAQAM